MNLSHLFLYLIATEIVLWLIIYTFAKSRRAKQWLIATTLAGVGWVPLYVIMANINLNSFTLATRPWDSIELMIVSGLSWGIASSIVVSRKAGEVKSPVKIGVKKVVATYGLVALVWAIALIFNLSIELAGILLIGVGAILLTFNNPLRLAINALVGLAIFAITIGIAVGLPALNLIQGTPTIFQIADRDSLMTLEVAVLIAISSIFASTIAYWWLEQSNATNHQSRPSSNSRQTTA